MMKNKLVFMTVLLAVGLVSCPDPTAKNAPPSVGISVPAENAIVGTVPTISLDGPTDPDNDAIDKIEYRLDGGSFVPLSKTEQGQSFFLPNGLSEGAHSVSVKATDKKKGNFSDFRLPPTV